MKQTIVFLLITMSLTGTSLFAQQRDTVKTKDGRTIIVNLWPDQPKKVPTLPPKKSTPVNPAPTPTIIQDQPVQYYVPVKEKNFLSLGGAAVWLIVLSLVIVGLATGLIVALANRRRNCCGGNYRCGCFNCMNGNVRHSGNLTLSGEVVNNGNMNHSGVVEHRHIQVTPAPAEEVRKEEK